MKMEKILSVYHIPHLTRTRSVAAPNYTAFAPPPQLQPPLAVANFKNETAISRATAKTRINMRPPNSIQMRGLSTTSDQIPNKDSPVAPSAGNPCHDPFYKVVKPYKYQYRTKKNPEAEAEVDSSCAFLKQLLPLAWSPEQMIKKVFVFSHQVFKKEDYPYGDCCSKTDYKAIQRKFTEKGYGDVVPQSVYWNLADKYFKDDGRPLIPCTQPGMTTVCDVSINLLKIFLENDGEIGPDQVIEAAISDEEYQKLAVMD